MTTRRLWQSQIWGSAWQTDHANAARWVCGLKGVTLMQAEAMARHLAEENWGAITRVARALAAAGEVSGAELKGHWRGRDQWAGAVRVRIMDRAA
jgi:hypothetical protein